MKIRIKRHPFGEEEFRLDLLENLTLLDLLQRIKEEKDPTLTFRSMCRAGVCGTCAIKLDGKPALACSTWIPYEREEVLVEPIDGYRVIRDLVVDHEGLVSRLRDSEVWLYPLEKWIGVKEGVNQKTSRSWECILCGICDSVCPVMPIAPYFGGPLVLTRLYKHLFDPRNAKEERSFEVLKLLNPSLCTHCMNCSYTCPKRLMPELLIKQEEESLLEKGLLQKQTGFDFLSF
ncbi:MAG: succinate dehydrogenase/fumarate reductase iron-sulfur subunit [Aquificaceae bacterium]